MLLNVEDVKRNKFANNCFGSTKLDKKYSEQCGIMEIYETPIVAPHTTYNLVAEGVRIFVVKNEVAIESTIDCKYDEELGIRDTPGFGGTENEIFSGMDHGVKFEVDPLVKVHYALDLIKYSYGENEFSDIDNAIVLHNIHKCDLQLDLQTDK